MKRIGEYCFRTGRTKNRIDDVNSGYLRTKAIILGAIICACLAEQAGARPGDLDTAFGTNGTGKIVMHVNPSIGERGRSVVVQRNGKIVLAGDLGSAAARFNSDGTLDRTFASQGILNPLFYEFCTAMILDANDQLLFAGGRPVPYGPESVFHIRRFSPNGVLDTTFGFGGAVDVEMGEYAFAQDAVVQPDRKIVMAGFGQFGTNRDFGVVRVTPDGTPDSSFGTNGIVVTDLGTPYDWAYGVALQPDGKIVVPGRLQDSSLIARFAVVRYLTNGILDSTFNGTGKAAVSFGTNSEAFAIALQRDGKIVLGGWVNFQMALARFNSDGTVDTSFGSNGTGVTFYHEGFWDSWQKVIVQPDQKIIAYGHSSSTGSLVVKRYTKNGLPDPSFGIPGREGTALIAIGTEMSEANGITLQPDGKILIAATAYETNGPSDVAVARLENDAVAIPSISCPAPICVKCGDLTTLSASISDPSGLPLIAVWNVNGQPAQTNSLPGSGVATNFIVSFTSAFPGGTNNVSLTVTDSLTNTDSCSTSVTVSDHTPPVLSSERAEPAVLWPPNHKMVAVNVSATVTDNCDDSATWRIVQVASNQESNKSDPDWIITGEHSVLVRAERSDGTERVYSIAIQATDSSGNVSEPRNLSVSVSAGSAGDLKLR
jgi:uncharacterized delta-60 repeat protein